ncbi:creatinine amidohydrolase [Anaerosphaera aminiphila DSM 21120]|uniref:Creatinine amidohydrolase n=1 Tax=Anaerosphaera aminiphila DSM 21120 TaxID=1120995 RepID=A0A1M5PMU3_9FIRM|nr:creatininase family protein [Anaerosphaera aminiphila]SHH03054.1 creatinine amidohydrolase [Anaerosphaera aminiphila DSM 21120]
MKKTNFIKEMTWKEFDERRKETKTLIVPSGAIEVYGPHMPLGTDIIVANKLSDLIAEKVDALVAPCLEVGQSSNLFGFPGTVYCKPENIKEVYRDICESYIKWGFKEFFILNTHLHNTAPLNSLMEELENEYDVKCGLVGWWQYIWKFEGIFESEAPHGHASESGTSVMLYLHPELVDMEKAVNSPSLYKDEYPSIQKYKKYDEYSVTGTMGDATIATAEKGKIVVEKGIEEISNFINNYLRK